MLLVADPGFQRSWGKVMFSQASVILLTAGGGGMSGDPPGRPLLLAVRILLEYILVKFAYQKKSEKKHLWNVVYFAPICCGNLLS